jgi:5'-phosphate synthase pdxT subunit
LLDLSDMREPVCEFASRRPVLGTCAGLILLARELADEPMDQHGVRPLGLIDCVVRRNGYGRQIDSFTAEVNLAEAAPEAAPFRAVFIRAPRILACAEGVAVLATRNGEAVAVRQGHVFGLAFHPELTPDLRLHEAFLATLSEE